MGPSCNRQHYHGVSGWESGDRLPAVHLDSRIWKGEHRWAVAHCSASEKCMMEIQLQHLPRLQGCIPADNCTLCCEKASLKLSVPQAPMLWYHAAFGSVTPSWVLVPGMVGWSQAVSHFCSASSFKAVYLGRDLPLYLVTCLRVWFYAHCKVHQNVVKPI